MRSMNGVHVIMSLRFDANATSFVATAYIAKLWQLNHFWNEDVQNGDEWFWKADARDHLNQIATFNRRSDLFFVGG